MNPQASHKFSRWRDDPQISFPVLLAQENEFGHLNVLLFSKAPLGDLETIHFPATIIKIADICQKSLRFGNHPGVYLTG
jgi:hypothetical protein